jgi:hypothetical protein
MMLIVDEVHLIFEKEQMQVLSKGQEVREECLSGLVQALSALANAARTCGEITSMRRQVEEFCSQSGCRDAPELPTAVLASCYSALRSCEFTSL